MSPGLTTVGSDGGCSESMAVPFQTASEHGCLPLSYDGGCW